MFLSNDADVQSRFGLKYPSFNTDTLLSGGVQRVQDSMHFFALGRFGREVGSKNLLTFNQTGEPVSWITPWGSCPDIGRHRTSQVSNQVS